MSNKFVLNFPKQFAFHGQFDSKRKKSRNQRSQFLNDLIVYIIERKESSFIFSDSLGRQPLEILLQTTFSLKMQW